MISQSTVNKMHNMAARTENGWGYPRTNLYIAPWSKRADLSDFPVVGNIFCDCCRMPKSSHNISGNEYETLCHDCIEGEEEYQVWKDTERQIIWEISH